MIIYYYLIMPLNAHAQHRISYNAVFDCPPVCLSACPSHWLILLKWQPSREGHRDSSILETWKDYIE